LYTDGVTEARDRRRAFYPLAERLTELGGEAPLLDALRDDLLRYVGAPLDDDAALVLVRAPARWPKPLRSPGRGAGRRDSAPTGRAAITGT
ncbi:MAG: SpoIIE family protein phosphatase, partial [Trebonia sp.]